MNPQRTCLVFALIMFTVPSTQGSKNVKLEDDAFLQLLEVEIARTLRSELPSDDDLQMLEGSGILTDEFSEVLKPKKFKVTTTPTTTTSTPSTTKTTTTTTTAPLTTTKKRAPQPPRCVPEKDCFKDADCPLGSCLGSELGICDCNACVTNKKCSTDAECGGLRNACDSTGYCDCVQAFHSHGYKLFVKVILTFCHQRKCTSTTDNCYGLPCRIGKCKCASGTSSNLPVHYFTTG